MHLKLVSRQGASQPVVCSPTTLDNTTRPLRREPLCKILNNEYYREELHDAAATAMANLSKNNYLNRTQIRKFGGLERFVAYYRERQVFPPPGWANDYIPQ